MSRLDDLREAELSGMLEGKMTLRVEIADYKQDYGYGRYVVSVKDAGVKEGFNHLSAAVTFAMGILTGKEVEHET